MSGHIAIKRVQREFIINASEQAQNEDIQLQLVGNKWTKFKGQFNGPPGTPYESGIFNVLIDIPKTYPFKPPKVIFVTKVWHPSVSYVTGEVYLDILDDRWVSTLTLRSVLRSLQNMLASPEANNQNLAEVVGVQYRNNLDIFIDTAKFWTYKFANGIFSNTLYEYNISIFLFHITYNISDEMAIRILSSSNWDISVSVAKFNAFIAYCNQSQLDSKYVKYIKNIVYL